MSDRVFPMELVPPDSPNFMKCCDAPDGGIAGDGMCFAIEDFGDSYACDWGWVFSLDESIPLPWVPIIAAVAEVAWRKRADQSYNAALRDDDTEATYMEAKSEQERNARACRAWGEENAK